MAFIIFVYIVWMYSVCRSMLLRWNRLDTVSRFMRDTRYFNVRSAFTLEFSHMRRTCVEVSYGGILRDIRRTSCMRKIILAWGIKKWHTTTPKMKRFIQDTLCRYFVHWTWQFPIRQCFSKCHATPVAFLQTTHVWK